MRIRENDAGTKAKQFRLFLDNVCGSEKNRFRSFYVFGKLVHLNFYWGFIGNDVHNFPRQFLSQFSNVQPLLSCERSRSTCRAFRQHQQCFETQRISEMTSVCPSQPCCIFVGEHSEGTCLVRLDILFTCSLQSSFVLY